MKYLTPAAQTLTETSKSAIVIGCFVTAAIVEAAGKVSGVKWLEATGAILETGCHELEDRWFPGEATGE